MSRSTPATDDDGDFPGKLTARQRQAVEALRALLARPSKLLVWHHEVGRQVTRLRELTRAGEHGFLEKLAEHFDVSASALRKDAMFYNQYSPQEARELDNDGCNWGLMTIIMHVRPSARKALLTKASKHKWGVAELKAAVRRQFHPLRRGGRPFKKPRSLEHALQQLGDMSRRWTASFSEAWHDAFAVILDELARAAWTAERREQLRTVIKQVEATEVKAGEIKRGLEKLFRSLR